MQIIILRGGSGSGKSTWTRRNCEGALVFSADQFFTDAEGNYNFDVAKIGDAHADCMRRFVKFCQDPQGHDVAVVDNTNTSVAELAPYAGIAGAYGYDVQILTFVYDPVAAFKRNTHGTPLKSCIDQHRRLMEETSRIPPWWNHDYVLFDETWPYAIKTNE